MKIVFRIKFLLNSSCPMFFDSQMNFAVLIYGLKRQKNSKLTLVGTSRKLRHQFDTKVVVKSLF